MAETCCEQKPLKLSEFNHTLPKLIQLQLKSKPPTRLPKMAPALRLETLELLDDSSHICKSPTLAQQFSADDPHRPSFTTASTTRDDSLCSSLRLYSHHCNASSRPDDDSKQWYNDIEPEVAKVAARLPRKFLLPPKYSLDESTEQNYSQPLSSGDNGTSDFTQPFGTVRRSLDYNYHCHYTHDRQLVQDDILFRLYGDSLSSSEVASTKQDQWIIFTAGPMGAGKSYTLQRLSETGKLSLENFVLIDLDAIRRELPEYPYYASNDPATAGDRTRKEAGHLTEIATLAALRAGRCVVVDGSLRAYRWYCQYFARLRAEFPALKIAIFYISAPQESILHNAADRALETGRFVPLKTLEIVMEQVPRSMAILGPLADDFVTLVNHPKEEDGIEIVGEDWNSFEQKWSHRLGKGKGTRTELLAG